MKCPECKGRGIIGFGQWKHGSSDLNYVTDQHIYAIVCQKCEGTKNIDWVENVMNKRITYQEFEDIYIHGLPYKRLLIPSTITVIGIQHGYDRSISSYNDLNQITFINRRKLLFIKEIHMKG